jgi:hypothetical protein
LVGDRTQRTSGVERLHDRPGGGAGVGVGPESGRAFALPCSCNMSIFPDKAFHSGLLAVSISPHKRREHSGSHDAATEAPPERNREELCALAARPACRSRMRIEVCGNHGRL